MERYRYIAKRLLTAIPTFLGINILVYVVASLAPSSPLEILFNDPYATAEEMARKSKELGLDQPVIISISDGWCSWCRETWECPSAPTARCWI